MNEEEKEKESGLPWIYRVDPGEPKPAQPWLLPGDSAYKLFRNTRNPFLKRALAPTAPKLDRTPEELQKLFRLLEQRESYRVAPTNEEPPFSRRRLVHPPPPKALEPIYRNMGDLPGDPTRLPLLVREFFDSVLTRLQEHPDEFIEVVDELGGLAKQYGLRFRTYESYHTLADWDDLIRTLEEISRYPAAETFDLFCSALFDYRDLL